MENRTPLKWAYALVGLVGGWLVSLGLNDILGWPLCLTTAFFAGALGAYLDRRPDAGTMRIAAGMVAAGAANGVTTLWLVTLATGRPDSVDKAFWFTVAAGLFGALMSLPFMPALFWVHRAARPRFELRPGTLLRGWQSRRLPSALSAIVASHIVFVVAGCGASTSPSLLACLAVGWLATAAMWLADLDVLQRLGLATRLWQRATPATKDDVARIIGRAELGVIDFGNSDDMRIRYRDRVRGYRSQPHVERWLLGHPTPLHRGLGMHVAARGALLFGTAVLTALRAPIG